MINSINSIQLRPISILDSNMRECIELSVAKEQEDYVASNAHSLASAYMLNKRGIPSKAAPYAIYADGVMVGFVMYGYFESAFDDEYGENGEDYYYFWRFMMDAKHQGKGYGRQVMQLIMDEVRTRPFGPAEHFFTSYEPANAVASKLYEAFGFENTGQVSDGENVMRCKL